MSCKNLFGVTQKENNNRKNAASKRFILRESFISLKPLSAEALAKADKAQSLKLFYKIKINPV
jgi:hypothetical protein